jgi:predicted AAA+ superfamily ATPase
LWDEDTATGRRVRVIILGSAPLLIERGLSESLSGRFEVIHLSHWSYPEMFHAFGWTLDQYLYFGGYPGSAPLINDVQRWSRYVLDSLIETTIARDVLLLSRVDKPALLRRLFQLACGYSGQVLSYTKMLGQLHDAGNTTTLAHYLDLLSAAGMVTGLNKYSGAEVRRRGSSPKLQVYNTALMTAQADLLPDEAREDSAYWGRLVESAVGAYLVNSQAEGKGHVYYWRDPKYEVDFVVALGRSLVAIEVKSGVRKQKLPGLAAFDRTFKPRCRLLVGADGIPLGEFLSKPLESWLKG